MMADEMIVYFNGEMTPASQVALSIYDRGFLYGDAVFDANPHLWRQDLPLIATSTACTTPSATCASTWA